MVKDNRLATYGGRIIETDGRTTVELRDPNDNAKRRFQYRRTDGGAMEKRTLQANGKPYLDGSPWTPYTADEIARLRRVRGAYHPILDPLEL